ncbi:uncharacterized protein BKA55DRAFT_670638 [Fusarium redolens]|uniref:C2H2-type domain-containing protein n=1 Tax=Fusarium redolens TaxID=48865 RepID=A0A9P9R3G8_FUSRE|nr:uncharacterized protein BKA55DRAFT_670638 [Fusarium redolens]KAH7266691.1 hypothetical protein BKA55DRAFT_670638 [Fusarium redolens]
MDTAPIKCPYASHITRLCQKTFQSHEEAAIHLILDHNARPILLNENGRYICLYGKDFGRSGCQETFSTQKATTEHLELAHQNETEPIQCPISSKCKINCYTKDGLLQHVQNKHRVAAYRCTWENCSKTFANPGGLNNHIASDHKGKKWYPPVKECEKEYKSDNGLRGHMKAKHPNWQDAPKPQPSKRRRGKANVPQTSGKPAKSVKLKCPFSYCNKESDSRDGQVEGCLESFPDLLSWEKHTKDHKSPPVEYHACRAEDCSIMFKSEHEAQAHYQKRHIDLGYGPICPTCNETFWSNEARRLHELKHTHKFVCSRLHCNRRFETCEMAIEHSSGTDHDFGGRTMVNQVQTRVKASFLHPGAKCRILGLRLGQPENGTRTITLNHVCVSCFTMKRARAFLEQGQAKSENSLENVDLKVLRDLFADAAEKEWTCPPEFQRILERIKDIEEGNMPPCSLLIVDTEFSLATRQPWEVAIIEYLSGKTRLNTLLHHSSGLSHESESRRIAQISKMQAKNIYNPKRNLDRLNVHQVAQRLKEIGTNSDTLFIAWATNPFDLHIFRNYLEAGGYSGILPDDEHCIPLCQTFRQNLSKNQFWQAVSFALGGYFPDLSPRAQTHWYKP